MFGVSRIEVFWLWTMTALSFSVFDLFRLHFLGFGYFSLGYIGFGISPLGHLTLGVIGFGLDYLFFFWFFLLEGFIAWTGGVLHIPFSEQAFLESVAYCMFGFRAALIVTCCGPHTLYLDLSMLQ